MFRIYSILSTKRSSWGVYQFVKIYRHSDKPRPH